MAIFLIFIIFINIIYSNSINPTPNELSKVFYHLGRFEDNLVFYFKKKPKYKICKNNNISVIFQDINISNEAKLMLENINNYINDNKKSKFYNFYLKSKNYDFEFNLYDLIVNNLILSFFEFDAISLFKGFLINISHKNLYCHYFENYNYNPVIIIDSGHGGSDFGTIGYDGITKEKDLTYIIGSKLKELLNKKGYIVFLTRTKDDFIALDKRTTYANFLPYSLNNLIFLSLHFNYSKNTNVSGLETHYLDNSLLKSCDNNFNITNIFSLKSKNSKKLGSIIHNNLLFDMRKINTNLIDRGIKKSVSQVLLGTEMPSILIELGFLSNKIEADFLISNSYQKAIINSIANSLDTYFKN